MITLGNKEVTALMLGSKPVVAVYKGVDQVWPNAFTVAVVNANNVPIAVVNNGNNGLRGFEPGDEIKFSFNSEDAKRVKSVTYGGVEITPENGIYTIIAEESKQLVIIADEADAGALTVELNNQWRELTEDRALEGYDVYESNSNKGVNNGVAKMRVTFEGVTSFAFKYRSDAESSYDYLVIGNLDTALPASPTASSGKYSTSGKQGAWYDATFETDGGSHFIDIAYRKDGSTNSRLDRGFVAFPPFTSIYTLATNEVRLSSEGFIEKKNGYKYTYKYYEQKFLNPGDQTQYEWRRLAGYSLESKEEIQPYFSGTASEDGTYKFGVNKTSYNQSGTLDLIVSDGQFSFDEELPELNSLQYAFKELEKLTSIVFNSNFDTSTVTNMTSMFYKCSALTSLDLTNFDTSNVTNMASMFLYCSALTSLDLSNFDTSNVTNMSQIFQSCSSLTILDLSNFDTSNVTNMYQMFDDCRALTSLDLTNFDTSNVEKMENMFLYCSALTSLDLSNFDTSKVTSMVNMFHDCKKLTTVTGTIIGIKCYLDLSSCPLTAESAMVFINGLASVTSTKTLRLKKSTYNALTAEQIAVATSKGWTVTSV